MMMIFGAKRKMVSIFFFLDLSNVIVNVLKTTMKYYFLGGKEEENH